MNLGTENTDTYGNKALLSEANAWDRILTSQEIAEKSQKCNAGLGNLVSWAEMYDASKAALYSKPSTCKAKISPSVAAPASLNTASRAAPAQDRPQDSSHVRKTSNDD